MLDADSETELRVTVADVHEVGAAVAGVFDGRAFAVVWMQSARSSGPKVFLHRDDRVWVEVSVDLVDAPYLRELIAASLELRRRTIDEEVPAIVR